MLLGLGPEAWALAGQKRQLCFWGQLTGNQAISMDVAELTLTPCILPCPGGLLWTPLAPSASSTCSQQLHFPQY